MVRDSTMEPTFYEENSFYMNNNNDNVGQLKRSLTLDLNNHQQNNNNNNNNKNIQQNKRPRLCQLPSITNRAPMLTSPDLNLLGLTTPDLEKFIINPQNGLLTPTTNSDNQNVFLRTPVTEAQEQYVRGFVDALNELHHSDSSQEPSSIHGATYTTLEPPGSVNSNESISQNIIMIKDEPQTVPSVTSSPPMSPIDMENQEKIKLERKRQRNRVAASKCRRRKLERISRLEDKVKLLKGENTELSAMVHKLKEHVCLLKEQVMEHFQSGCQIMNLPIHYTS